MSKLFSILNYLVVIVLLGLAFITAPITYCFVYPFKDIKWVREKRPFWLWFDDEDGFWV